MIFLQPSVTKRPLNKGLETKYPLNDSGFIYYDPSSVSGNKSMKIRYAYDKFGIFIEDVDLRTIPDTDFHPLRSAIIQSGVGVIRDQLLAPADLVSFAERFGKVEYGVRGEFQHPDNPDVYVISNIVEDGKPLGNPNDGFAWHTDLSFLEHPTAFTFLYAVETPPSGGNTEFASAALAYDRLPAARKAELGGMQVCHSYKRLHATRKNARALTEEELRRMPDVIHPMVRTHPDTGRRALYLGPNTSVPIGMTDEAGLALMDELMEFTVDPAYRYVHVWKPGDLVVWDNRTMVHRATEYDKINERRLMHRTTVKGERPV